MPADDDQDLRDVIAAAKREVARLHIFASELQSDLPKAWGELMDRIELVSDSLAAIEDAAIAGAFPAMPAELVARGMLSESEILSQQIFTMRREIRPISRKVFSLDDLH